MFDPWIRRSVDTTGFAERKEQSSCAEEEVRDLGNSFISWWFPFPSRADCNSQFRGLLIDPLALYWTLPLLSPPDYWEWVSVNWNQMVSGQPVCWEICLCGVLEEPTLWRQHAPCDSIWSLGGWLCRAAVLPLVFTMDLVRGNIMRMLS